MSSHGSSASDRCEPNLVPLLDMVLQLVMFFMVCANFVMEQVNETIQLPVAQTAMALGAKEEYVIFLNINQQGQVLLSSLDVDEKDKILTNEDQVRAYMKRRYEEDIRGAGGDRSKPPRSVIILRADKATPFEKVYGVMRACQSAGYPRAQLRAIIHGGVS